MTYFHLLIERVPAAAEESISQFCFDWAASGVAQELAFVQTQFEYQPDIVPSALISLNVYFENFPGEGFAEELSALFPQVQFRITEQENKDWLAEWKKSFQPFALAGEFWIVPSWCATPAAARHPIFIDPGMAFGTGTHATTQLAAQLLRELPGPLGTVLDVGTGTGILAILAEMLGAAAIAVTDIDPLALEVAAENFAKNQCAAIEILPYQLDRVDASFDVVTANIVDGILLELKAHLIRVLKARGCLILSGILEEREADFVPLFLEGGGVLQKRVARDGWVALQLGWLER